MPQKKQSKKIWIISLMGVALLFVAIALFLTNSLSINYAKDVANPIERALTNAGATKICEGGDGGHGPGNNTPWYTAYFETSKSKAQAQEAIEDIASKNGYSLRATDSDSLGYLGDQVYIDSTKDAPVYSLLQPGKVQLSMALTNSGPLHACPGKTIDNNAEQTAVTLEVRLPSYR